MKRVLNLTLVISLFLSLTLQASASGYEKDFEIDKSVTGDDRNELIKVMRGLDEGDRKNVLLIFEDGHFVANKPELKLEFIEMNQDMLDSNGRLILKEGRRDSGANNIREVSTLAYTNPSSQCTSDNSGPFRRVMSKSGYSRLTANIYLPDKAQSEVFMSSGTNDKAYIYAGAVTSGGQVDMGVALNYAAGSGSTNETWGMIVKGDSSNDLNFGNYKMGQTVFFKYYTPVNNSAALYIAGKNKNNEHIERTLVAQINPAKGFKSNGSGMTIKRVTSIAQAPQNLTTGSYVKNVHWQDVKIGTTSGSEVLMNSTNTASFCGYQTSNVLVDYTSQSNEKVWVKAGSLP